MNSVDIINNKVDNLILETKLSLSEIQKFAISEAWKILQLAIATVIQIIESIGQDLTSPEKKELAMKLLDKFYDSIFIVIDIPFVPNMIEPMIHKYIKAFLMILVSSTIDALVTTFRNTGVFIKK